MSAYPNNIRREREARRISRRALAKRARIGLERLWRIERGDWEYSVQDLVAIAAVLGVDPSVLIIPACDSFTLPTIGEGRAKRTIIAYLRYRAGLVAAVLARDAGISLPRLRAIEAGVPATNAERERLEEALGCSTTGLLTAPEHRIPPGRLRALARAASTNLPSLSQRTRLGLAYLQALDVGQPVFADDIHTLAAALRCRPEDLLAPDTKPSSSLRTTLNRRRTQLGLSVAELACVTSIPVRRLRGFQSGLAQPTPSESSALASALECEVADLVEEADHGA